MYCVRCGKQIPERDDYTCDECRAKAANGTTFEYAGKTEAFEPFVQAEQTEQTKEAQAEQTEAFEPFVQAAQTEQTKEAQAEQNVRFDENGYNHDGYFKKELPQPQEAPKPAFDPTKTGFGKALAATIVGVIGMIVALISFEFSVFALAGETSGLAVLSTVIALGMGVLSLVFGVQSIRRFKAFRAAGAKRPVATLVLGIVGVAAAAYALLFVYFSYSFLSCGLAIY